MTSWILGGLRMVGQDFACTQVYCKGAINHLRVVQATLNPWSFPALWFCAYGDITHLCRDMFVYLKNFFQRSSQWNYAPFHQSVSYLEACNSIECTWKYHCFYKEHYLVKKQEWINSLIQSFKHGLEREIWIDWIPLMQF